MLETLAVDIPALDLPPIEVVYLRFFLIILIDRMRHLGSAST